MPVTGNSKPVASSQFQPACQPITPQTLPVRSAHADANSENRKLDSMTSQRWFGLKCSRVNTSATSTTATATPALRASTDCIQPRNMTSSTLDCSMKPGNSNATCSRLCGDCHASPQPVARRPPAAQIADTTSAMVPMPIASPCANVFSGAGPTRPMLANDRRSTKRTHASTSSRVGTKPIHSSACSPGRPIGSPRGVDHCRASIQSSSAITGTALNRIIRIGTSQIQGNQPRAGSGEYRATRDMWRSGTVAMAPHAHAPGQRTCARAGTASLHGGDHASPWQAPIDKSGQSADETRPCVR